MWFQGINRSDADKVFRNIQYIYSTAASVVGQAVSYDVGTFDGVRATRPATANLSVPAGIIDAVIAVDDYGPIQIWGPNANALVDGTTGLGAGDPLAITNGSFNLTLATAVTNAAGQFAPCFVAGEAYTTGAAAAKDVFVSCL
jgi:hypothetical protein